MAKQLLVLKGEVFNVNARKNGGQVTITVDVRNEDNQTQTAGKAVNITTSDVKDLDNFKPGQKVTVTIEQ